MHPEVSLTNYNLLLIELDHWVILKPSHWLSDVIHINERLEQYRSYKLNMSQTLSKCSYH